MQTTSTGLTQQERISINRLALATVVAAVAAALADLLVYFLVPALFDLVLEVPLSGPGSAIQRLPAVMVVMGCVVPAIGGGLLLAALNRFTARPIRVFHMVALGVLLISLIPLFALPVATGVILTLAVMHVLAAALITYVLTTQSRAA